MQLVNSFNFIFSSDVILSLFGILAFLIIIFYPGSCLKYIILFNIYIKYTYNIEFTFLQKINIADTIYVLQAFYFMFPKKISHSDFTYKPNKKVWFFTLSNSVFKIVLKKEI